MLCKGTNECLCIEEKFCCSANDNGFGVGIIKDSAFIIKLGLPCCSCGIKVPDKLCLGTKECLCVRAAQAFPFAGPVPKPMCAICGFSLMPEVGLMKPPPAAKGAPTKAEEMER